MAVSELGVVFPIVIRYSLFRVADQ
jgi:hypothetical protein